MTKLIFLAAILAWFGYALWGLAPILGMAYAVVLLVVGGLVAWGIADEALSRPHPRR